MKHLPDMLCAIDKSGRFVRVNDSCEQILGFSRVDLEGKPFIDFVHEEDRVLTSKIAEKLMDGESVNGFENRYVGKDGGTVKVIWTAVWSPEENLLFCSARKKPCQQKNEVRLAKEVQWHKSLFENHPDVIFYEDTAGKITKVNETFIETFNCKKEEVTNSTLSCLLPPKMADMNQRYLEQTLLGSTVRFDLEYQKDGEKPRIFDTVKFPVKVNQEVIGVQTIAKDITDMVHAYETIQLQAKKLNTIFESITDAFFTMDREWNFAFINREAERILGINKNYHIGKNAWKEFPSELGGEFDRQYQHAMETMQPVHFEAYFSMTSVWLEVKAFPSSEGISIYFTDITENVKARKELEKLSLVASKTNNSVLIADKDWRIEWVNLGFTDLTGYSLVEAMGRKPSELLHSHKTDIKEYKLLEPKLLGGEPISLEVLNVRKNGEEYWVNIEISPAYSESGEISRFIEVQTDISSLKNKELELSALAQELYRKNTDLQQFTYIVSHNLRSPIANIMGLADALNMLDKQSESFHKALSYLKQDAHRLDTVMRDMNSILSIRDSKYNLETETVDLTAVINEVSQSFGEKLLTIGADVSMDIQEGLSLRANRAYMYSIFHNLVSNSIKYRSPERPLRIRIKAIGNPSRGTIVSFSDNGIGFDMKKAKDNLFRMYKRFHAEQPGRGMGLFLVKNHLDAMGGSIKAVSGVGFGTRFMIYLPS